MLRNVLRSVGDYSASAPDADWGRQRMIWGRCRTLSDMVPDREEEDFIFIHPCSDEFCGNSLPRSGEVKVSFPSSSARDPCCARPPSPSQVSTSQDPMLIQVTLGTCSVHYTFFDPVVNRMLGLVLLSLSHIIR